MRGRTYLAAGLVDEARAEARRTLAALSAVACPVVGLEPSCLLTLRDEFPLAAARRGRQRAGRPRAAVSRNSSRARSPGWRCKPIAAAAALLHGHCHQKAFGAIPAAVAVLTLVPELKVDVIESSCCGMAGSFGYEAEHYEVSMRMAELSLLPAVRRRRRDLIVADGTSCRHQIADGAGREALHASACWTGRSHEGAGDPRFLVRPRPGPLPAPLVPARPGLRCRHPRGLRRTARPRRGDGELRSLGGDAGWRAGPLLVLDQFPRNLHRGTAAAFALDPKARAIARQAVLRDRQDLALPRTDRCFLYLPFEHAEALAGQDLSVALFEGLRDDPVHAAPGGSIAYAWAHRAVIRRFGRFPHRNAALGRADDAGGGRLPGPARRRILRHQ